jgi:hypothetical protein
MEPNRKIPSGSLQRDRIGGIEPATPLGFPAASQSRVALHDRPAEGSSADNIPNPDPDCPKFGTMYIRDNATGLQ